MTNDRYIVYAVTVSGARFRVSKRLSWDAAQARWKRLNDQRRQGRTMSVCYAPQFHNALSSAIRYFVVRAANDPEWPTNARQMFVHVVPDRPHTTIVVPNGTKFTDLGGWAAGIVTLDACAVGFGKNPLAALVDARLEARRSGII